MNLLRLIGSMNPTSGGPCQGIRNSIPELEQMGIHNEVACLDAPDAAFLGMDTFPVHALGPGKFGWSYSPMLIPWLMANLHRFDVVLMHGLWQYPSYAVSKVIRQLNARNVPAPKLYVMPHGMLDPYFQRASERRWKTLRNEVYWKLIEGRVVNEADGLLFTCEEELRLAREPFRPYRPKQEVNVGYGILPPPAYDPSMQRTFFSACPAVDSKPYLLFLSRIHPKKGVDLLLDAYAEFVKANPKQKVPLLVVAGPGTDTAYGKAMQKRVMHDALLKNSVFFPGMLSGDAKWGAFYGCEAFVLPSHQENFGIAVVEALACGKPVLLSNQVNIWKEIETHGAGLVAENSLSGTIRLLTVWQNLTLSEKKRLGVTARQLYENQYEIYRIAGRLASFLSSQKQSSPQLSI